MPNSSRHSQIAQRLLDAVGKTRCFPLRDGLQSVLSTPADFHSSLCQSIQNAHHRASLATLYVGTGDKPKEKRLLQVMNESKVPVRVLMDANRGTRPVKGPHQTITSSAKAVSNISDQISLFQPLGYIAQKLPTPLNEVAGVFHIKAYIADDKLILSGANLSEEYFVDRQDRYIQFQDKELVDFYANIIQTLHQSATEKTTIESAGSHWVDELSNQFRANPELDIVTDGTVSAYAIPTFQAPNVVLPFASDTQQFLSLLDVTAEESCSIRLASAYLNPTPKLLAALLKHPISPVLLTAGPLSHGFAPKPGVKRRGDWVPKVFEAIAYDLTRNYNLKIRCFEREGWTFHGKGLWVMTEGGTLVAAVVGSGNYGHRSERLDVESNCILIFPNETSALQEQLLEEWERLNKYTEEGNMETHPKPLVWAGMKWMRQLF